VRRALLIAALAACHPHATPKNSKAPDAGVSIAIYERDGAGYSVVDDRRWIDVAGSSVLFANIDPGADLASLVIEPTNRALHIGSCTRERLPDPSPEEALEEYGREQEARVREESRYAMRPRIPPALPPGQTVAPLPEPPVEKLSVRIPRYAPVVHCEVTGAHGRYLVRILYVSTTLRYRAQHEVDVHDATHATVVSRFAIATPPWREHADVVLFDGVPGAEHPPQEVTRGSIELDGATAVLSVAPRDVAAELRRVFDGAIFSGEDSHDVMWGKDSNQMVWVWLELASTKLAPGPVHVHVDLPAEGLHDIDVAPGSRKQEDDASAPLRLPLRVDEDLRGMRARTVEYNDGGTLAERLVFGIGNMGETAREVIIEEHLRPAAHRKIERAWPGKPVAAAGEILRSKVDAKPGRIARTGYTLEYQF
jgi:hypothetical protein